MARDAAKRVDYGRRALLLGGAASLLLPVRQTAIAQSSVNIVLKDAYVPRIKHALLIGNRNYPNRKDIPPAHKNVSDVAEAMEYLEFKVTRHLDLDAAGMRAAVADFGRRLREVESDTLPGSLAVAFYFCGHGFQSEGNNFLVPAGIDPSGKEAVKQSLKLIDDVLLALPRRYPGISIALIDACRTDPNFRKGEDDLNQITAPEGTLVFFATRAGRPALAPIDPNRNTFFAAALANTLNSSNGVTPIDDLFQLAAFSCQQAVKAEFDKAGLSLPLQFPEATINLRGKFVIRNRLLEESRQRRRQKLLVRPEGAARDEEARWQTIQQTLRPRHLVRLCEAFLKDFPASEYQQTAFATLSGARQAVDSQRAAGLSTDALEDAAGDADYRDDLVKALRGDKDAAHRIALMYREGSHGLREDARRDELWLRFAAELGNGIASWQLSEYYGALGMVGEVAKYERRALELGYRPPPRLSNRGY